MNPIAIATSHPRAMVRKLMFPVAMILSLCACGGGSGSTSSPPQASFPPALPVVDNPAGPGYFDKAIFLGTLSAQAITNALPANTNGEIKPLYAVDAYKVTYTTFDTQGRAVLASGLVAIPQKTSGVPSPLLSYQHATIKTDAEAPSNHATADEPAILFASLGYLVSASDYVGYGASKGKPHPYLLAAPSATAVIDFMIASNRFRQTKGIQDNGQQFLTGYSEGAYVSMATLRQLTQNRSGGLPTATYVGAGPYSVTRTLNDMAEAAKAKNRILGLLITPGLMKHLGANDRANVSKLLLSTVLGESSDVLWDSSFLENFLNDDSAAISALSDVYDWTPQSPISFFHGRDDTTVSYANTELAITAMQARGAGAQLEKLDCNAQPASHLGCVAHFLTSNVARFARVARGL